MKQIITVNGWATNMPFYIHKHSVVQRYGGAEEGGWWYDSGIPERDWNPQSHSFLTEDAAYETCRLLSAAEHIRRKEQEDYEYTSVLAHMSNHYSYSVEDSPFMKSYPEVRPHYE